MIRSIGRSDGAISLPDLCTNSNEEGTIDGRIGPDDHDARVQYRNGDLGS
jgi:hypothetical protein